jgi:toxin FitB
LTSSAEAPRAVADTSVAVPALLARHPEYESCADAIDRHAAALAGHAWFETFSILTRLPGDARVSPALARRLLVENFPRVIWATAETLDRLTTLLDAQSLSGGAVYDALVACCAVQAGLPLLSRDERAAGTYAALGIQVISPTP